MRLTLILLSAALAYAALKTREVLLIKRDMQHLAKERDGLLNVVLKQNLQLLLHRIQADKRDAEQNAEALRLMRPVPKRVHPERSYTDAALLMVTGIRDVAGGENT